MFLTFTPYSKVYFLSKMAIIQDFITENMIHFTLLHPHSP